MGDSVIALTHVRWDLEEGGTMVHLLDRNSFDYLGSERVEGSLYTGGNADFRISEAAGVVRLVTTEWTGDPEDALRHRLYTLGAELDAPELDRRTTRPIQTRFRYGSTPKGLNLAQQE